MFSIRPLAALAALSVSVGLAAPASALPVEAYAYADASVTLVSAFAQGTSDDALADLTFFEEAAIVDDEQESYGPASFSSDAGGSGVAPPSTPLANAWAESLTGVDAQRGRAFARKTSLFVMGVTNDSLSTAIDLVLGYELFLDLWVDPLDLSIEDGFSYGEASVRLMGGSGGPVYDEDMFRTYVDPRYGAPDNVEDSVADQFAYTLAAGATVYIVTDAIAQSAVYTPVPLPGALPLAAAGLGALALAARRRKT